MINTNSAGSNLLWEEITELSFVVIGNEDWEKLIAEFGEEKLKFYFSPVTEENAMFNLSMDQVFSLIELREKNNPN